MTPDRLLFPDGIIYVFVDDGHGNHYFQRESGTGYEKYWVYTVVEGSDAGASYTITITGFNRDDPPPIKNFRLTFRDSVSKESLESVENYLKNNLVYTARLTGPGCDASNPNVKSHLCLDTVTTVKIYEQEKESHLQQTIAVKGTFVPGNVAAPGEISGFSLGPQSLAVGGTIDVNGGTKLRNYLATQTAISWSSVEGKLNELFNQGVDLGAAVSTSGFNGRHYSADTWNLNALSVDPAVVGNSNSFSSPPEGKLWRVNADENLTIGNGNGSGTTTFSGSGTIVFTGARDVNVTFKRPIACSPGTRLAFITKGNITFEARASDGYRVDVGCGSYTSLNGNINFAPSTVKEGDLKGIFVASKNIILPKSENLTGPFTIGRDDLFASNPTVLLREILKLVFSPS